MNASKSSKSGSALLLTLLVVSLLLVIVLSFTVYVRLELRVVSSRIELLQARQNAKLGMQLALAQLQKAAGPDQRVTATAGILGNTVTEGNRYWTGVWQANGSGSVSATTDWMVSGLSPDPEQIGGLNLVELLPAAGGNPAITAPSEEIKNKTGDRIGDFAYWVSDEGVKVSLSKTDPEKQNTFLASERGLTADEMDLLPQITPGRTRNEIIFPSILDWDSIAEAVSKTTSYEQFSLAGLLDSTLTTRRHQATWRSMGILSNSEKGGLKQDLSFSGSVAGMDDFSRNADLQSWVQHRTTDGVLDFIGRPIAAPPPLEGEPVFTIPVVITEFGLFMRFSRVGVSDNLRFQVIVKPEIWNPYSFPINTSPVDTEDLIFEFSGLPELNCTWITGTSNETDPSALIQGSFTIDPQTELLETFQKNIDSSEKAQSLGSVSLIINYSSGLLNAGTVYTTSVFGEKELSITMSDTTGINSDDYMEIQAPASLITLRVKNTNGETLQEFTDIPFPEINTTGRRSANDILNGSQVSSRDLTEFQLVYYFRLEDETPNGISPGPAPIEEWFTESDPRSLSIPLSWYNDSINVENPDDAALTSLFQSIPDLFDFSFVSGYFPVFDIPAGPPISVGSLQHLQFANIPPFSVGNTWGDQNDGYGNPFNGYFDSYFFSTVPQSGIGYIPGSKVPLPNTHLEVQEVPEYPVDLATLRSPFSSKSFLVNGSFNINSLDPVVWQAILGSLHLTEWENETGASPTNLSNGIFRTPFGAENFTKHPKEDYPNYPEISSDDKAMWYREDALPTSPLWANAFRVGMRELRESELQNLAIEITDRIADRALPFISIRELADSELLQDAIDATTINSVDLDGKTYDDSDFSDRMPRNSPSFVSQADILQLLAPFISARSDTFIIRAYGNVRNGTTIAAEQVCEAIIQRTTEPLTFRDKSSPSTVEEDYIFPPDEFGRRFKIISFRWVNP